MTIKKPPIKQRFSANGKELTSGLGLPMAKDSLGGLAMTRLVENQLTCLLGDFDLKLAKKLWRLYPEDVEFLALDLLKFTTQKDLLEWLKQTPPGKYRPD